MTKYEDKTGQVSDLMIEKYVKDEELQFTDDISHAIYLLRNGKMIDGAYESDYRTEDHKTVQTLISEGKDLFRTNSGFQDFWNALHVKTGMIRLVPETKEALILKTQKLTNAQKNILASSDFRVDKY